MSNIRSKNTQPELVVRKILTSLGIRYKLYSANLPGKPDIVIGKRKTAIFINGCFWHQHNKCDIGRMPKSNIDYWKPKLKRNIVKQKEEVELLNKLGYRTFIYWECETKQLGDLMLKINDKLII